MRLRFAGRSSPVVGAALEIQVVDGQTGAPVPAAPAILEKLAGRPGFRPSLYQSIVQVETGVRGTVAEAAQDLYERVAALRAVCDPLGLGLIASATHPVVGWRDLHIDEAPRAQAFVRRLQWVGRRAAVFGLRLHVGVPDGEKAIAIGNAVATLVPLFVALSASSPFWRGHDTGLASCRTRVIENIPNAGLPPPLLNFAEFQAYVRTLRAAETIDHLGEIWWDARPNLALGTLELQACDAPHTLREAAAMMAFAQAVVVWLLENYESGHVIPQQDPWIVRENKWRATRFGIDAELVTNRGADLAGVRPYYARVVEALGDRVSRLGLEPHFEVLSEILEKGPGYVRQRTVCARQGLEAVPIHLMEELREDRMAV